MQLCVVEAYETFSDPTAKQYYDQYGNLDETEMQFVKHFR